MTTQPEAYIPYLDDTGRVRAQDVGPVVRAQDVGPVVAFDPDDDSEPLLNGYDDNSQLLTGVDKVYSTSEAAEFFNKSNQWLYWGMRNNIFTDLDGNPIEPERIGKGGRRRFTLPVIREIALSCYRRGNLKEDDLKAVLRKILVAESDTQKPE